MSVDTRPIYRLTLDRYLDRPSTDMSIDTRPICWSISAASRPTFMSVDTRSLSQRRSTDTADTLLTLGRYSTDTWSALSALFSTQTAIVCVAHHIGRHMPLVNKIMFTLDTCRSRIDRHYRMTLGRNLGSVLSDTTSRHSANISVEY